MPGLVEIVKTGKDTHELRIYGGKKEKEWFRHREWIDARNVENINSEHWPPERKKFGNPRESNGAFYLRERAYDYKGEGPKYDSVRVFGASRIMVESIPARDEDQSTFHVDFIDETAIVGRRKERIATGREEYVWRRIYELLPFYGRYFPPVPVLFP